MACVDAEGWQACITESRIYKLSKNILEQDRGKPAKGNKK
jgi:hypothetical protein